MSNKYIIKGDVTEIVLQDGIALIDTEDIDKVSKIHWYKFTRFGINYVKCSRNGATDYIQIHRLILNAPRGKMVDHVNHDGLDNRKINLRLCTNRQNQRNSVKRDSCASKYKGVAKVVKGISTFWYGRLSVKGKRIYTGHFKSEVEAAKAYDKAAKKYYGKFASLNFANQ